MRKLKIGGIYTVSKKNGDYPGTRVALLAVDTARDSAYVVACYDETYEDCTHGYWGPPPAWIDLDAVHEIDDDF